MMADETDILLHAREVFFQAMIHGYAGNVKPVIVGQHKEIHYTNGEYTVIDQWRSKPDGSSYGITVIFYQELAVWIMSYKGMYPDEAIPFLKMVLSQAYCSGMFVGGRGLHLVTSPGITLQYKNGWKGDFNEFSGREQITDTVHGELGHHTYHGRALIGHAR
jgi:hypothetical protein